MESTAAPFATYSACSEIFIAVLLVAAPSCSAAPSAWDAKGRSTPAYGPPSLQGDQDEVGVAITRV